MNLPPSKRKPFTSTPQQQIASFWARFFTKHPGKVTSIFPRSLYATLLPPSQPRGLSSARNASESYESAAAECRDKVRRIVRECHRTNEKFTDPDFDLEDYGTNCLNGLVPAETYLPGSVHRVDWVFERPRFTVDGFAASDIKQGANGDCWWLAAVATVAHRRDLMERVCVARDAECGVYGFCFQRDGEWVSTVVDDNLYLRHEDFAYERDTYDATGRRAREHRATKQTGSEALYFDRCSDKDETWLPLLTKAYAKVHGDYEAISGGFSGEAVEDMTGGVATTIVTNRVLRKDALWRGLVNGEGEFVFALSAIQTGLVDQRGGLALGHAYSVLMATEEVDEEGRRFRLVQIRNPWGERLDNGLGEWNGPWSDGSKEWTPYWQKKLNHRFGDDGVFWMSYGDMLDTFRFLHRTRLFDERWTVVQQWTSVHVGWVAGYLNTKFLVEVRKAGMVVFVLTQLDDRYFRGFEGQYEFALHFLLQREGGEAGEHISRVRPAHVREIRSVSCEVELEPGRYEVLPKITARRNPVLNTVEEVVKKYAEENPQKLRQVGMQYDLAHAKGGVPDEDELLAKKREEEKAKRRAVRKMAKLKAKKAKAAAAKKTVRVVVEQGASKKNSDETAAVASAAVQDDAKKEEEKKDEKKGDEGKQDEEKKEEEKKDEKDPAPISSSDNKPTPNPSTTDDKKEEAEREPSPVNTNDEKQASADEEETESDSESDSDSQDDEPSPPGDELEDGPPPWNAVCVVGLRVYATDPNVSITLVKPKNPEEASSLTMDSEPAGATM